MSRLFAAALAVAALVALAAEGWHDFVWFGARAKRAEAVRNLSQLCRAQRALLTAGRPSSTWRGLDPPLERGNRYAYFISPGGALELRADDGRPAASNPEVTGLQVDPRFGHQVVVAERDVPSSLLGGLKLGVNGACPACTWVMVAIGNIDVDPELDVVSVSTGPRVSPSGKTVDACVAFVEHDDTPPGPIRRLFHEAGARWSGPRAAP
ncbi:MAG: hypothetical protein SFW67_23730 [Myxococcaceae bacterium]|nr:hypothetical protein [Myxococcaceae bacterium]